MIDKIEEVECYLDENNCYLEPQFSTIGEGKEDTLLMQYQGQELYPYALAPQNMGELRKYISDVKQPIMLHSGLEIDSFDGAFNVRQNSSLAWHYIVQFGLGEEELAYAKRMLSHKFRWFLLSVPHGASQSVVDQVVAFRMFAPDAILMVGDFYNQESIDEFVTQLNNRGAYRVDYWQIALQKNPLGLENLGLASVAKIRLAGYPVVVTTPCISAKLLFFALACGAKWVNFTDIDADFDRHIHLHQPLLELAQWQNIQHMDDIYEHVTLKWRR